jgi:tetratricopeptide (TPR) repeat protein
LDREKAELPGKRQSETFTPAEWFERGRALDDESEAEVEYYEKAIELDPEFVPALYRLGAIYYRRANYELADQQFAKFLKPTTSMSIILHTTWKDCLGSK